MSAEPCISIAMATYNGACYIREQLDSIAAQTMLPCELVVTDDGSTDATLEIVRDFAQGATFPVRVYSNDKRLGFSNNFFRAASLCGGEYIAFCDQDDVWLADKLATCVQPFADAEVLLVIHAAQVVGADLTPSEKTVYSITSNLIFPPMEGPPWEMFNGFAMIFRASLLEYAGPARKIKSSISESYLMSSHDLFVYFIASSFGKIALLSGKLLFYRQHESNLAGACRKRSLKEKINISFNAGRQAYLGKAMECRHRIDILNSIKSSSIDATIRRRADHAQYFWSRIALANERRSKLYSDYNMACRLHTLIVLIMNSSYRPYERGGFGLRGLVKDITFGLFWRGKSGKKSAEMKSMGDS
jgi:glycosyltransferase involved in cell wall biosynthesis